MPCFFLALGAMHDGSRWTPDKPPPKDKPEAQLVGNASGSAAQVGTKAKELLFKGRVELDQIALNGFVLTDTLTYEAVTLPKGVWRVEAWDDVPEMAIVGCRVADGCEPEVEEELDMLTLFQKRAYKEPVSGVFVCVCVYV